MSSRFTEEIAWVGAQSAAVVAVLLVAAFALARRRS